MTDMRTDTPLTAYKALTASISMSRLIAKRRPEDNICTKFHRPIFEDYGSTETIPVASVTYQIG